MGLTRQPLPHSASTTNLHYLDDVEAVLGVIEGEFSYENYKQSVADLMKYPLYQPGMNVIWDLRRATSKPLTADDVQLFASHTRIMDLANSSRRMAVILPDIVDIEIVHLFQSLLDDAPFVARICHTMEEARSWLHSPTSSIQ